MKKNILWLASLLFGLYVTAFISGCQYHTYYQEDAGPLPPGKYEVKESVPVEKSTTVERNYVVE